MELKNLTPFPAISWESVDAKQQWFITTLVRVKYTLLPTQKEGVWKLALTPEQEELFGEDVYYNDDLNLPIKYESDFITYKKNTDIIINAKAQSVKKHPNLKDDCEVCLIDKENKTLSKCKQKIYGQHPWLKNSNKKNYSTGFGFVNRTAKSRLSYAGNYDEKWLNEQHPYPPHDFDYYYHQAATPKLIMNNYIPMSGMKVSLYNLMRAGKNDGFQIPELLCFSEFESPTGNITRNKMNIDTLLIDIDDDDMKNWAVYLSYRLFKPKVIEPKVVSVKYLPVEILEKQHGG